MSTEELQNVFISKDCLMISCSHHSPSFCQLNIVNLSSIYSNGINKVMWQKHLLADIYLKEINFRADLFSWIKE